MLRLSLITAFAFTAFALEAQTLSPKQVQADSTCLALPYLSLPRTALDLPSLSSPLLPKMPSNLQSRFVYDPKKHLYFLSTYYNGSLLTTPLAYTEEEFRAYVAHRQDLEGYRQLNSLAMLARNKARLSIYDPTSYKGKRGLVEQLFGTGGLQFHINASVDLSAGIARSFSDNPSLSERAKSNSYFDFKQDINADITAKLGTKLNFSLNYNTEATFSPDAKRIKLSYNGEQDDIIKLMELGQVSMATQNSLIAGAKNLFGLHGKLQFGRLTVDMLMSQQRSDRRQIRAKGNAEEQSFELSATEYDENRHFFLSDFFRSRYDEAVASRPYINSGVQINRIELWVTNRRGKYDAARNLVAFADLGEPSRLHNANIRSTGGESIARNRANSLYEELSSQGRYRDLSQVHTSLDGRYRPDWDYDRQESARRLEASEYTLNERLGYVSLNVPLRADEVLAVAYEYSYRGQVYQVGEFGSDRSDTSDALFVKLLKGRNMRSDAPYWHYMMRNVYAIAGGDVQLSPEGFVLDAYYRSSEVGTDLNYVPSGAKAKESFMSVLGWDRLSKQGEQHRDGYFDYLEGITINASKGWIYLPSVEPFGKTLQTAGLEEQYIYSELYKQSPTEARRYAEKNKYQLRGRYRGHSSGVIQLSSTGLSEGAVRVIAGGQTLQEGADYTVDYTAGTLRIINQQILQSNLPIDVSLEDEGGATKQRQSILGLNLQYQVNKRLSLGATAMYLSELPLLSKARFGQEAMSNLLWGANLSWRGESPWLQRLMSRLPFEGLTKPSSINFDLEYAQLRPSYNHYGDSGGYSYIDDFESSQSEIDLRSAYAWSLSSVPYTRLGGATSPIESADGRGHLSWFSIDPLFTRENTSLTPSYIRARPELVSSHYVREVSVEELYPSREQALGLVNYLPTLNLRFYPHERGMYNLNTSRLGADGRFRDPEASWGGIMRRLDVSDFEAANIEYLEFWLMDPNMEGARHEGASLFFDLGDISEDILRDGKKSYENGLPATSERSGLVQDSPWGVVPTQTSIGYAFDASPEARRRQDVGLDGLPTDREGEHRSYQSYRNTLLSLLSPTTQAEWRAQAHSPLNDPAGDDFHHYRGEDYDSQELGILDRYKYYNGMEGNSRVDSGQDLYSSASRTTPDVEDINQDNNLNELDRYYEYRISLRPEDLRVGTNYVVASRTLEIRLRNGEVSPVTWYQFRVPLSSYTSAVGGINDMRSMRFMRMYLAGCKEVANLRFGALRLMRGDWRAYTEALYPPNNPPQSEGKLSISAVNIEEHSDRKPINYILPTHVSRSIDAGATQSLQANEQSLALRLVDLSPHDARAVYRTVQYDLRRYKRLQLFAHAEELLERGGEVADGDLEVFIRLGTDFRHNYFEYSAPLKLTPQGRYHASNPHDRLAVWPRENTLELDLEQLVGLKRERLRLASLGSAQSRSLTQASTTNPQHQVAIVGNPSLSTIRSLMIGVRNRSTSSRSVEVWLNELRVGELSEQTAHALRSHLGIELSDLASLNLSAAYSTAGFGALEQSMAERQRADKQSLNFHSNVQLGKLLPSKLNATIPLYISLSHEATKPEYSPRDEDLKLSEALQVAPSEERQRLEHYSLSQHQLRNINLTGVQIGIRSQEPMPYDPANFTLNFSHSTSDDSTPAQEYHHRLSWQAGLQYDYAPTFKPLRPFAKLRGKGALARYLQQYGLNLWPSLVSLQTSLVRNYEEEQLRNQMDSSPDARLPLSFSHQFVWYRKMNLNWRPTPNLHLSLQTGTDARIEAPNVQVNRSLNPDDYALWREAVDRSIAELGLPQRYTQEATASYTLPTSSLPWLSWINSTWSYNGSYQWELGANVPSLSKTLPNTISNQRNVAFTTQLRMSSLYRRISALARVEKLFASSSSSASKGKGQRTKPSETPSLGDRLLYSLMMLRELNISVRNTHSTHLPGYLPAVGSAWGQRSVDGVLAPGLGFALGLNDESLSDEFLSKGYLSTDASLALSAVYSHSRIVDLKATLQPVKDLNISLTANHSHSTRQEHQYSYSTASRLYGGDMQMTTIGLRGFFSNPHQDEGYSSPTFNTFLSQREDVHRNLSQLASQRGSQARLDLNSPAVLIPAFRQSYMGQSDSGLIPSLWAMLPNWSIVYNGLGRLKPLNRWFSNISLRHTYRAIYRINSYDSFASWRAVEGTPLGEVWTDDGSSSSARLSYLEDVASVSLSESFFPLLGADLSLKNGLTLSNQWRRSRSLTLSLSTARLIETLSNEWSISASYRIDDLRKLWKPSVAKPKRSKSKATSETSPRGLTLKLDYSHRFSQSLIRQISDAYTQATAGNVYNRLNLSLDYELSKYITLRAYYELSRNTPLVSETAYSTTDSRYGLSLRLNITQ